MIWIKSPFVSLKITYRKIFFEFSGVCFTENKWSTKNIFLINEKSSHFSVKYFTDFKSVRHFTKKKKFRKIFYGFEIRKIFYRKMVWFFVDQENIFRWPLIFRKTNTRKFKKYFSVNYFQWNKRVQYFAYRRTFWNTLGFIELDRTCNYEFEL